MPPVAPVTTMGPASGAMPQSMSACTLIAAVKPAVPSAAPSNKPMTPSITTTSAPPAEIAGRTITVRFDSNVAPGLPWRFEPERRTIDVKLGQVVTVYYSVTNESARTTTAQAGYNVTPPTVGIYFEKINCFCFTEQTMKPGEKRDMAVVFYVDPKLVENSELDGVRLITLSYTFYPVRVPDQAAAESPPPKSGRI